MRENKKAGHTPRLNGGFQASTALLKVHADCSTFTGELPASQHDGYSFARACSTGL